MVHHVAVQYRCEKCQGTDCKLWRTALTYTPHLLCIEDLARENKVPLERLVQQVDDRHLAEAGWWFPAIPQTEDLSSIFAFWGYSLAPKEEIEWWFELPTTPRKYEAMA